MICYSLSILAGSADEWGLANHCNASTRYDRQVIVQSTRRLHYFVPPDLLSDCPPPPGVFLVWAVKDRICPRKPSADIRPGDRYPAYAEFIIIHSINRESVSRPRLEIAAKREARSNKDPRPVAVHLLSNPHFNHRAGSHRSLFVCQELLRRRLRCPPCPQKKTTCPRTSTRIVL